MVQIPAALFITYKTRRRRFVGRTTLRPWPSERLHMTWERNRAFSTWRGRNSPRKKRLFQAGGSFFRRWPLLGPRNQSWAWRQPPATRGTTKDEVLSDWLSRHHKYAVAVARRGRGAAMRVVLVLLLGCSLAGGRLVDKCELKAQMTEAAEGNQKGLAAQDFVAKSESCSFLSWKRWSYQELEKNTNVSQFEMLSSALQETVRNWFVFCVVTHKDNEIWRHRRRFNENKVINARDFRQKWQFSSSFSSE